MKAHDGWQLYVRRFEPNGKVVGTVIVGHAMMADSKTVARPDRPCVAACFLQAGFRTLVADMRGHGKSGPFAPSADWSYDDIVADTGALVEFALGLENCGPLFIVGHSLVGHTGLAWLGQNPTSHVAGFISVAGNTWQRRHCASWRRSISKHIAIAVSAVIVACCGCIPTKKLGYGSADEARTYAWQLLRYFYSNRWTHARTRKAADPIQRSD